MKVYFVGSHSTGKTTLARYVSEQYKVPMITEVARMVLSEKEYKLDTLRHDMDLVDDYQATVFQRQMIEETKYPSFVSDRRLRTVLLILLNILAFCQISSGYPELTPYLNLATDPRRIYFFVRPFQGHPQG